MLAKLFVVVEMQPGTSITCDAYSRAPLSSTTYSKVVDLGADRLEGHLLCVEVLFFRDCRQPTALQHSQYLLSLQY